MREQQHEAPPSCYDGGAYPNGNLANACSGDPLLVGLPSEGARVVTLEQLRTLAKTHGVSLENMDKIDLVRAIQRAEGYFACFAPAPDRACDQIKCLWRNDCFAESQEVLPAIPYRPED